MHGNRYGSWSVTFAGQTCSTWTGSRRGWRPTSGYHPPCHCRAGLGSVGGGRKCGGVWKSHASRGAVGAPPRLGGGGGVPLCPARFEGEGGGETRVVL